jgi:hypothetical protein
MQKLFSLLAALALFVAPFSGLTHVALAASGYVTLDSWSGTGGTTLNVSGGGWDNGETVNIYFGNTGSSPATSATIADGMFSISAQVPVSSPQGPLKVIARTADGDEAENSFYVTPLAPQINVEVASHTPGGLIKISGSGFGPSESVSASLGSASASTTADASGQFSNLTLTIPQTASNVYLLTVSGQSSGASAVNYFWVDAFWASVTPSVWYVEPGHPLAFSGSGFSPFETITISGAGTSTLSVTADNLGSFTEAGSFTVPSSLRNQLKTFTFTGNSSNASAQTMVMIGDLYPYAYPSTYYDLPGNNVSFSGGGFGSNETIDVFGESGSALANFTTDAAGNFTTAGATVLPFNDVNGTANFTLTGRESGASTQTAVTIGVFYPSLTPSTYFAAPGAAVSLNGSGFANNESVAISINGTVVASTTAPGGNLATTTVNLPHVSGAFVTLSARGSQSGGEATVTIMTGSYYPTVTPSLYYAFPGDVITFTGSGFAGNETVTLSRGAQNLASLTTDNSGSFSASSTIPFGSGLAVNFSFTGATSNSTLELPISIGTLMPYLTLDKYYAVGGDTITASGVSFAAGETVTVSAPGFASTTIARADGSTPEVSIGVPFGSSNPFTITFTGNSSGAIASTPVSLGAVYQTVTPDTYYIQPGGTVTFSGSGFIPNESVSVSLNNTTLSPVTVNGSGSFTQEVKMPFGVTTASVVFTANNGGQTFTVPITLAELSPTAWLSSYYAAAGSPLTIYGSGFAASEAVTVKFSSGTTINGTTDTNGNLSLETMVPYAPSGTYNVMVTGALSGSNSSVSLSISPVYTGLTLGSYAGAPGTAITFNGSGYLPNEPIQVTTNRSGGTIVRQFNAGESGSFSDNGYTLPADWSEGALMLTVTSLHSFDTKNILFYVTGN